MELGGGQNSQDLGYASGWCTEGQGPVLPLVLHKPDNASNKLQLSVATVLRAFQFQPKKLKVFYWAPPNASKCRAVFAIK